MSRGNWLNFFCPYFLVSLWIVEMMLWLKKTVDGNEWIRLCLFSPNTNSNRNKLLSWCDRLIGSYLSSREIFGFPVFCCWRQACDCCRGSINILRKRAAEVPCEPIYLLTVNPLKYANGFVLIFLFISSKFSGLMWIIKSYLSVCSMIVPVPIK